MLINTHTHDLSPSLTQLQIASYGCFCGRGDNYPPSYQWMTIKLLDTTKCLKYRQNEKCYNRITRTLQYYWDKIVKRNF